MPVFNVTIPDSSPLIEYGGPWSDTPMTDNDWEQYQNQTYHITTQDGATASLTFNGSAIYIYGARKPGYDGYSVVLDGASQFDGSATADVDQFNTLLYSATSLDATKQHRMVLQNVHGSSQGSSMDIDYIVITAGDGNERTTSQITFLNQDDPSVLYSANWIVGQNANYSSGTAQITYIQGASATVSFEGNAVALYGTINNDHGLFSVSIDGGSQTNFNGFAPQPRFQMLLFYSSGLPSGRHTLKLTNVSPRNANPSDNGLELDTVSFASWPDSIVSSAPSSGSTATTTATSTTGMATPPATAAAAPAVRHTHTATIVGAIIGAVGGVALFAVALFFYYRRHRNPERQSGTQQSMMRAAPFLTPSSIDRGMGPGNVGANGGSSKVLGSRSPAQTPTTTPALLANGWSMPTSVVYAPQSTQPSESSGLGYTMREAENQESKSQVVSPVSTSVRPLPPIPQLPNPQEGHCDLPPPAYRQVYPTPPASSIGQP